MRHEKDYIISYRRGRGSYPCTALVNAYSWKEAEEKIREHIRDNYKRNVKPEFINWIAVEKEIDSLIFHRGIVMNSILDIRE